MLNIRDFMLHDHLHCDDVLARTGDQVTARDWHAAAAASAHCQTLVVPQLHHLLPGRTE